MIIRQDDKSIRIGMFYDGGYLNEVSDYYRYSHQRNMRLSIQGIHTFVCQKVSEVENVEQRYCHVVDSHYFQGRLSAVEAEVKGKLFKDRKFEEMLMKEGVTIHYLPRNARREKGIGVLFALVAYELSIYNRFDIIVLVANDSDFLPLIRKVNSLGTRVMVLGWNFEYINSYGEKRSTTTSMELLNEATYPIMMHTLIDDITVSNDSIVNGLFIQRVPNEEKPDVLHKIDQATYNEEQKRIGKITRLEKEKGFGLIVDSTESNKIWFFHKSELMGLSFEALNEDDVLEYNIGDNPLGKEKGLVAIKLRKV